MWRKHGAAVREFRYGRIASYPVWKFQYDAVNSEGKSVTINTVVILGAKEHAEIQIEMERQSYRPKVVAWNLYSIAFAPDHQGADARMEVIQWGGPPSQELP